MTKYYICLSDYTVIIMIKPREKHLPKFTKGVSNSATRKLLLAKHVKKYILPMIEPRSRTAHWDLTEEWWFSKSD